MLHQQNQSRENSPDTPSVPNKTQEELQKPQATPQSLPAEGEYEQEAAEMVMLPMEFAGIDKMIVLDGKLAMSLVCGVNEGIHVDAAECPV